MSVGPIEVIVVEFPGNRFNGKIIPELRRLVDAGTIRIVDGLLISRAEDEEITILEIDQVTGDPDLTALADLFDTIDAAEAELRAALADLRELAQGIFPAMLAEEGLSTAIEALAEAVPLAITALPGERFGVSVEAAAYFVVAETVRQNAAGVLRVCAARRDGRLVIEVEGDSAPGSITDLEDRVGALGGSVMTVREPDGRTMIRAEIPCES